MSKITTLVTTMKIAYSSRKIRDEATKQADNQKSNFSGNKFQFQKKLQKKTRYGVTSRPGKESGSC